jgi:hypothetical protein
MIRACMIILSCYTGSFTEHNKMFACAVNANQVAAVEASNIRSGHYYLQLSSRKLYLEIAETPSQVLEKVNNCK